MAIVLAGLMAGTALAVPQDFLPSSGGVAFKFTNYDQSGLNAGDITHGVFHITSIQDIGQTTTFWTDLTQPGPVGNLNGRFDGLTQLGPLVPAGGGFDYQLTGGTLTIYNVPSGAFVPTSPTSPIDPQICGGPCPQPWLIAQFASGIDSSNPAVTVAGNQSATTSPFTAHSAGYLNVIGGTEATRFDSNGFMTAFGPRDLFLESNFCTRGTGPGCTFASTIPTTGGWLAKSNDPVVGYVVPEPATLMLLGSGLVMLGMWRLRRMEAVR
jgi:hypothetical protein